MTGEIKSYKTIPDSLLDVSTLEQSERKYRTYIQKAPIGIFVIDDGGNYIEVNEVACQMTGYSEEELLKKSIQDLLAPEHLVEGIRNFNEMKLKGFAGREFLMCKKDGGKFWKKLAATKIDDKRYVAYCTDITQNKQTERKLQESVEKLDLMTRNLHDVIIETDLLGNHIYASPSHQSVLGRGQEVIGQSCFTHIHPEDRDYVIKMFKKGIKKGSNKEQLEYRYFHQEKGYIWLGSLGGTYTNKDNEIIALITIRDITIRKEAEEALKESENKFRSFVENSSDIIFTLNDQGIFTYISPHWKNSLGHDVSEVINQPFANFVVEEDHKSCFNYMGKMLQDGLISESVEYRVHHKDGNLKWHSATGSVIKKDGEIILMGIARDITQQRQTQELLKYQLKFEKMISHISSFFLSLPSEKVDHGINYALIQTGEFFQVDRSYIFQFSEDGQKMNSTHWWSAEGIKPKKGEIQKSRDFPIDKLPWWSQRIKTEEYVLIPEIANLPLEAAAEKKEFQSQGIRSLLCIPIIINGNISGFLGFETVREMKVWSKGQVTLLKIVAELISNSLARQMADQQILHLSFHDNLTGLFNRAYLEKEVQRLDTQRQLPISIIMADINGLKLVNDTYGHKVGDEVLVKCAEILKISCREEDIIARWGGDEFLILLPQTSEADAHSICKRMIKKCHQTYVEDLPLSMALGVASKKTLDKDLAELLKIAEDNMYKHKITESRSAKHAVLNALLKTLKEKSYETEKHVRQMQGMAHKIGEKMGLPEAELTRLSLLISLHDIGKININEEILTKSGKLTQEEWEIIKKHPEIGYRIARSTEEFAHVAYDILCHHERWDGEGYPHRIKEKEIPFLARITAIADAYEVMANGRPYKEPLPQNEIIVEFQKCSGKQFDPKIVEVFLKILDEEKAE